MNVRRTIVLAAVLALAPRAGAGEARSQPPSDKAEQSGTAERARELGQRGADAVKRGASAAREKVNQGGQAATAKVVGTKTVDGKISGVSPDRLTVKRSDGTRMDLRITDATKVTVGGKEGSAGALRQGDEVRASYAQSGGSATATAIEVKRAPEARPRKPKIDRGRPGEAGPTSR